MPVKQPTLVAAEVRCHQEPADPRLTHGSKPYVTADCSGQGEGMTLEEQKSKLAAARAKAQGALGTGHCGDLSLGSSMAGRGVRGLPLGLDRKGACYWKLQAAEAFGGMVLSKTQLGSWSQLIWHHRQFDESSQS